MSTPLSSPVTVVPPPLPQLPLSHFILMGFAYPSALLYIWVFIVIVKNRRSSLQSTFYDLVIIKAIADFVMFLSMEVSDKPRKYRWFPFAVPQENSALAKFAFVLSIFARNAMYIGCFPFAINRFTMFYFPTTHKRMWERKTIFFCFLCQWAVPILANTWPLIIRPEAILSMRYLPNGVLQSYADRTSVLVNNWQNVIVGFTVIVVCGTLYMCTFKCAMAMQMRSETTKIEIRHLICCFFGFVPIVLEASRACVHFFGGDKLHPYTTELFFYTTQVACLSQGWSLICTNRLIQTLMFGQRKKKVEPSSRSTTVSLVRNVEAASPNRQGLGRRSLPSTIPIVI